jgi:GDP-4-dehydro-6-deoxy-D-mannose reductase
LKVLITGADGFVGGHLTTFLATNTDAELSGTRLLPLPDDYEQGIDINWWQLDLRDEDGVHTMLSEAQPDLIFHLAAQAFVPASFDDPWHTLENNIRGQLNIFQSILKLELKCRMLVVSSAEVYGEIRADENPVTENQPLRPANPYSVSKVAQDMLAMQYHLSHGLYTVRARAFNHIGPGQNTRFALPNFAAQIAAIEAGEQEPVIRVGNLEAERDFTDVRDVVRAYFLMLTRGKAGAVYNVCRGEAYSMQHLLDLLCAMSTVELSVRVDTMRLRPLDVPCVIGDATRLRQDTAWEPTIDIHQSLADILDHTRHSRT